MPPSKIIMTLTFHIPYKDIADLLCSAFEGGSNYWARVANADVGKGDCAPKGYEKHSHYIAPFSTGGYVLIQEQDEDLQPEEWKSHKLDRAALDRGLQLMAEKHPQRWADFITSNADSTTGDVYLQLCLLGEVRYG